MHDQNNVFYAIALSAVILITWQYFFATTCRRYSCAAAARTEGGSVSPLVDVDQCRRSGIGCQMVARTHKFKVVDGRPLWCAFRTQVGLCGTAGKCHFRVHGPRQKGGNGVVSRTERFRRVIRCGAQQDIARWITSKRRRLWLHRLRAECPGGVPLWAVHFGCSELPRILLVTDLLVLRTCQ